MLAAEVAFPCSSVYLEFLETSWFSQHSFSIVWATLKVHLQDKEREDEKFQAMVISQSHRTCQICCRGAATLVQHLGGSTA